MAAELRAIQPDPCVCAAVNCNCERHGIGRKRVAIEPTETPRARSVPDRARIDPTYQIDPPLQPWETELT
jgi:hypothetical protein